MIWCGDLEMLPCHIPSPTQELVHNGATFTEEDRPYLARVWRQKKDKELLTYSDFFLVYKSRH